MIENGKAFLGTSRDINKYIAQNLEKNPLMKGMPSAQLSYLLLSLGTFSALAKDV